MEFQTADICYSFQYRGRVHRWRARRLGGHLARTTLHGLQRPITFAITLHIDNQSAIAIANYPEFHDRTKHIEIRHRFLRHKVERGDIALDYVTTTDQLADVLAKGVTQEKHEKFPIFPMK